MKLKNLPIIMLLALMMPVGAKAVGETTIPHTDEKGIEYIIHVVNNTIRGAEVTGYTRQVNDRTGGVALVIPPSITISIDGSSSVSIPVTGIAANALNGPSVRDLFCSVYIASSVKTIGHDAFAYCSNLETVTINDKRNNPSALTTIGEQAFMECTQLTSINLPSKLTTIGDAAFTACRELESVTMPSTMNYIGSGAFNNCIALSSADLSATQIDALTNQVFQNCSSLQSVSLPSTLLMISKYVFSGCNNLSSLILPQNVNKIFGGAFDDCISLKDVYFLGNTPPDADLGNYGDLFSDATGEGIIDHSTIRLHVPFGATGYASHSYWHDFSIIMEKREVTDDQGISYLCSIDDDGMRHATVTGFSNATITAINIAGSVSCEQLSFPVTAIAQDVFVSDRLQSVYIPASVASIGAGAFSSCTNLNALLVAWTTPISIDPQADPFPADKSAINLFMPDGTYSAYFTDPYWTQFFRNGGNITFADEKVKAYCVDAERGWDANHDGELNVAEAASVTSLGTLPADITSFNELRFFTGLTSIDDFAFANCSSLTEVSFPRGLTTIGQFAFQHCSSLTELDIPEGVTTIGQFAFNGYRGIVTLPSTLTSLGINAFQYTEGAKVKWTEPCETLTSDMQRAFGGPTNKKLYVPIGSYDAYLNAPTWSKFNLREYGNITFADPLVKSISISVDNWDNNHDGELSAEEAFDVSSLETTDFQGTAITSFNELKYFRDLYVIGVNAFKDCANLTEIVIPERVRDINADAFAGCNALQGTIRVLATTPPTVADVATFPATTYEQASLIVPTGTLGAYRDHEVWGRFANISEIATGSGNVNGGELDLSDALDIVRYILGNAPKNYDASQADVNGDGYITIADVTVILNIILSSGSGN